MDAVFIGQRAHLQPRRRNSAWDASGANRGGAVEDIADLLERAERHGLLVPQKSLAT